MDRILIPALTALLTATILATPTSAPAQQPEPPCQDKIVKILYKAGFRDQNLREAWAIVQRESNGQNLGPGHPAFNGADYGIWQVNAPSHADKSWFSYDKMLDPVKQSRIVYRWSKGGDYWTPWGLTPDGQLDTTMYGGWGPWEWQNWIIGPYQRYYNAYPKACR